MLVVFPDELEVLRSMQPLDRDVFIYLAERVDYETGVIGRSRKVSYGGIAFDLSEHDGERRRPESLRELTRFDVINAVARLVKAGLLGRLSKSGKHENLTLVRIFFADVLGKGNCVKNPVNTQLIHQLIQVNKLFSSAISNLGKEKQTSQYIESRPVNRTSYIHTTYSNEMFSMSLKWKPTQETFEQLIGFVGLSISKVDPVWVMDFISYWSQDQNQGRKYTQNDWTIKLAREMITYLRNPGMFEDRHGINSSKTRKGESKKHRMLDWASPPADNEQLCVWMRKHGYGDGPAGIPYHKTRQWLRNQIETRLKREGMT